MTNRLLGFLRSPKFLFIVLGFFTFESLWIALTSRYPMAFDEQQHFGVIQLHTGTWWPFFKSVPDQASEFGAIARDPSFLYHYLMSFPYRLIRILTDSLTAQVIMLRIINIGLVLGGLVLFRKLLLRLGLDGLRANILLLFFCLIPIFPLMAGQISYDNLTFLLAAAVLLLGVIFLQRHRHDGHIDAGLLSWLLIICLYASMVKYAFLPVFAATVVCLAVVVVRNWSETMRAYATWWQQLGWKVRTAVITCALIGLSLFAGSYGYNVVRYHSIVPRCDKVLTIKACEAYAPWNRDYQSSLSYQGSSWHDILPYLRQWFYQMMQETFFEISSYYDNTQTVIYKVVYPLPILLIAGWILFAIGLIAVIWNWRDIWRNPSYRLIFAVLMVYSIALFITNVKGFRRSGVPVAIHGRYLIPIMLPVMAIAIVSAAKLIQSLPPLSRWLTRPVKTSLLVVVFIVCLQGGLISFIAASNDTWFWPQSRPSQNVNRWARQILDPLLWHS